MHSGFVMCVWSTDCLQLQTILNYDWKEVNKITIIILIDMALGWDIPLCKKMLNIIIHTFSNIAKQCGFVLCVFSCCWVLFVWMIVSRGFRCVCLHLKFVTEKQLYIISRHVFNLFYCRERCTDITGFESRHSRRFN